MSSTTKIRELNDILRKTGKGGQVLMTDGVMAQGDDIVSAVMNRVREFNEFPADTDPYHEHEFGAISHEGQKYFWKIDYYNKDFEGGSEDPANALITNRVLTVMLAEEY